MKHARAKQTGWSVLGALAVVVCTTAGALFAHALMLCFDQSAAPSPPWGLLTVFLLPVGFAVTVYTELTKLLELKALSETERRRVALTIHAKQRQVLIAICFFVLSALLIAMGLFASSSSWALLHVVIVVTGGVLGISVASVPLLMGQLREVNHFKARVTARALRRKQVKAKLEKLTPKGAA